MPFTRTSAPPAGRRLQQFKRPIFEVAFAFDRFRVLVLAFVIPSDCSRFAVRSATLRKHSFTPPTGRRLQQLKRFVFEVAFAFDGFGVLVFA